jgi:hypothetical protein
VAGFCVHGNVSSGSIKRGEFFVYQHLKNDSIPWILIIRMSMGLFTQNPKIWNYSMAEIVSLTFQQRVKVKLSLCFFFN